MDTNLETTAQADVTETEVEATVTEEESSSQEETSQEESSQDFDIDAAIEEEKKRTPDPDKAKEAFKKREEKRLQQEQGGDESTSEEDVDDDKPLTRKEFNELLARERQQITNEARKEQITEIAGTLADSEKEREFIIAIHANRVFPSDMPLKDQLLEAHFIANGRRLAAKNQEVVRALKSKDSAGKDTATVVRDGSTAPVPKLAADVAASLKRAGYTYDPSLKIYKKPLAGGKFMYNDPRTKRTWVK